MDNNLHNIIFYEVNCGRLNDLEALFESRGGPKHCWCMVWRTTPEERRNKDPLSRKAAFVSRVMDGVPVGILGYIDDKPIAWCSIAPRNTYWHLAFQTMSLMKTSGLLCASSLFGSTEIRA